jgi:glycosyltransferase involved in cell wall biosynthesis
VPDADPDGGRRMRVGYYMSTPALGGAETYLRDLLWNVDRDRVEVSLFLAAWPGLEAFLGVRDCPGLAYHPLPLGEPGTRRMGRRPHADTADSSHGSTPAPSLFQRLFWRLGGRGRSIVDGLLYPIVRTIAMVPAGLRIRSALRRHPVDLLHIVNGGYPGASSAQSAALVARGVTPSIMTVCSTAQPRRPLLRRTQAWVDRKVSAALACYVVPGVVPGEALVTRRAFDPVGMVQIPWGVRGAVAADGDTPVREDEDTGTAAKHGFELPSDVPVIGILSRIDRDKGHPTLLKAVSSLVSEGYEFHLAIAGTGPISQEIGAMAAHLGLSDRTTFVGFVEDRFAFLRGLDIFTLPSDIEGLPYVVLEAMSESLPVVATDVGAMAQAVIEGETGHLVQPGDSEALAAALAHLLRDRAAAQRMGANGRALYLRRFTIEAMIADHMALYERLGA